VPGHRVKAVVVPRLKDKLGVLYQFSRDIFSDEALARKFVTQDRPRGIEGRSIRHWIYGDGAREANSVPAARFAQLVEIFRKRLPVNRSEAEVRSMLLSETAEEIVWGFMSSGPRADWVSLMLNAREASASIVRVHKVTALDITTRHFPDLDPPDEEAEQFETQMEFRLKLNTSVPGGWLALVQWGRSGCFGMDLDNGKSVVMIDDKELILPAKEHYFREEEFGLRRYVFLESRDPFPADMMSKFATSAKVPAPLDVGTLDRLAHVVETNPGIQLSALCIRFVEFAEN
jgi:hypothetical protein